MHRRDITADEPAARRVLRNPIERAARWCALFLVLGIACTRADVAAGFPERPVRIIMPNAAGGSPDTILRIIASRLGELSGQQFIVDNRAGGGGIIAVELTVKATPDGYTLLQCGISQALSRAIGRKLPFDVNRDLHRVVRFAAVPNILVSSTALPARNFQEFLAYARQYPGKLKYGSTGVGFSPHLTMEYLKSSAGIELLHVPYKAIAQAITDMLGGQIDVQFNNLPAALVHIRTGKMRGLAVTSAQRAAQLPDIPTVSESGFPDFVVTSWYGICAPAKSPQAVLARLEDLFAQALAHPDVRRRVVEQGIEPELLRRAAFDKFFEAEVARWSKVAHDAGIRPE